VCARSRSFPSGTGCEEAAGSADLGELFDRAFAGGAATACTGCHASGAGGLAFRTAAELREATVGRPSLNHPDMALVTPGDVTGSYLYWKLHPSELRPMPPDGPRLDDAALAQLAAWICAGAPAPAPREAPDAGEDSAVVVSGLDPSAGVVGTPVVISGTGFSPIPAENAVAFNGIPAFVEDASTTSLTTAVPAGATSGPVTVTVAGQVGRSALDFEVVPPNPAPLLAAVAPAELLSGGADATLTLTGEDFVARSTASWDDTPLATTFESRTRLTALVPAGLLAAAGDHAISVSSPLPGGGTSAPRVLAVRHPLPQITTLSPASALAGGLGLELRVSGTGLVAASTVTLNGAPAATSLAGPGRLSVAVPGAALASAGAIAVAVTNPAPGGGTSAPATLSVLNPAPTTSTVSPATAPAGNGAVTLTLDGSGFVPASAARLDGWPLATTFVSPTRLHVVVPEVETARGGTRTLTVENPAPGGGLSGGLPWSVVNPIPVAEALNPTSVSTGGAPFVLTVTGSRFVAESVVSLGASPAPTRFISATTLEATVGTLSSPGNYLISVTNPAPGGGTSGTLTLAATNTNAPTITGLAPDVVLAGAAFTLTVTGAGYACAGPNTSVVLLGASTLPAASCAGTRLTAAVGALAAGPVSVRVRNGASLMSNTAELAVVDPNPVPVLSSLAPSTVAVGGAAFTLTVDGASFVAGAILSLDGAPRRTTFVSSSRLQAAIPASDLTALGTFPITVTNPGPGGGQSGAAALEVVNANPVPTISGLAPASLAATGSGATFTVIGSGFVSGATGAFDGSARPTTFVSATELRLALTGADTSAAGPHAVEVTNPAPGGGRSNAFALTVVAENPVPVASSLSPATAAAGGGALAITVNGSGFVPSSVVTFEGSARPTSYVSATRLGSSLAAADLASTGTFSVRVSTPGPGGGTSGALAFEVTNPVPSIASLSPATVGAGASGFALLVNGSGFVASSAVRLDGVARTTRFLSSIQLSADLLAEDVAIAGTRTVVVSNPAPGGGPSVGATLTVSSQPNPAPTLATLSPCGKVAGTGAFTLTLDGSSFVPGATATFNGTAVPVTFVSATRLTAEIPAALVASAPANDAAPVVVTNPPPGGGSAQVVFGVARSVSTLSGNVQAIFTQNCSTSSCHGGSRPAGNLSLVAGQTWAATVGVASSCGRPQVQACGPLTSQSYLLAKVLNQDVCSGTVMPKPPAALTADEKQALVDWVAQGAPP
jgi:hypothetical protein